MAAIDAEVDQTAEDGDETEANTEVEALPASGEDSSLDRSLTSRPNSRRYQDGDVPYPTSYHDSTISEAGTRFVDLTGEELGTDDNSFEDVSSQGTFSELREGPAGGRG